MATRRAVQAMTLFASLGLVGVQVVIGRPTAQIQAHHDHEYAAHGAIGSLPGVDIPLVPPGNNDPTGQEGSGGRGIAHHAGGRTISAPAVTKPAPDALLFYVGGELGLEPTLGVNAKGSVFYAAEDTSIGIRTLVMRSRGGGAKWEDVSPATHVTTQDPFIWMDKTTGRLFDVDFAAGLQVSTTDDEGESWTSSTVPQSWHTDHQNLFAGPAPDGGPDPVGYPNVVYLCSIGGGALGGYGTATTCSRSLDGGISWVPTGEPAFHDGINSDTGHFGIAGHCGGEAGHGFADSRGLVYLARGWCGQPWLAISANEGATWERVQVADNGMPAAPGGLQEHEAGVAVDHAGNIYVAWTALNRLPYLAISRDGGKKFSKPMMIGPPGIKEASLPTIDVGDDGKIAIAYIGSTTAPGGKAPTGEGPDYIDVTWNGYVTITADALAPDPVFYTASINDPTDALVVGECPILRCQQEFDFIDVVIDTAGTPWTSMVDGCTGGVCSDLGLGIVGRLVGGPPLASAKTFRS